MEKKKSETNVNTPLLKTKKYTYGMVCELMDKKNFRKQFEGEVRRDGNAILGKLRRSSLNELASIFGSKVADPGKTPSDAFCVDGQFRLTPEQIEGMPDPLGVLIIAAYRQAMSQLFTQGGTSDFARVADCTKLQIYDPDPKNGLKVVVVIQFHIWYASTVDGMEPRRAN
jgi:hypothetical protein